jgi:hypothetical protein
MIGHERSLLRERLGRDEEGDELHPSPAGHAFRAEQDALACYPFPGWEQKRGLLWYSSFEHPDGRNKSLEENKCATGKSMTEWDAENVPRLVKGAGKLSGKKGSKSKRPGRVRLCVSAPSHLWISRDATRREPKRCLCRALYSAKAEGPARSCGAQQRLRLAQLLRAQSTGVLCQGSVCRRQVRHFHIMHGWTICVKTCL